MSSSIDFNCSTKKEFAIYNNELHAGGGFHTSNGVDVNHIARWDGTEWHITSFIIVCR